jgi:superfamily II DNA or RNA helicase
MLFDYQEKVVADFYGKRLLHKRILIVLPTGGGKTYVAAEIIRSALAQLWPALVLSHRREIIAGTSDKLKRHDIPHGIIQAGTDPRPQALAQVASIQTLFRRGVVDGRMEMPPAKLVIVDEAHHAPAWSYQKIIESYPDAVILGLTATPCRSDGRGLGGIFETIIEGPQVAELIAGGFLVRSRVYAPVVQGPDLRGVKTHAGDYIECQLADRVNTDKLVGDIVTHWIKYGENRQTVAFAVNVAHSIHLKDEFVRAGIRCEHIDASTPKLERGATLARVASGEIQVVTNCMVLTEGWDMPEVGCCILARPTKKMGLYRQMIGRVLRTAEGKPDAIILDHSGAVYRHGVPEDPVVWSLKPDHKAHSPKHTERQARAETGLLECPKCHALRVGGRPCDHCGYLPQRSAKAIVVEGELGLLEGKKKPKGLTYSADDKERWHGMLVSYGQSKGHKPGWASHKYREKFGAFPKWGVAPEPIPPSREVLSFIRSRNIAWAKGREKAL